jgi:hypothetical protein
MSDELWGEIDIQHWRGVPHISGRVASEEDVQSGRAVFYLGNPDEIGAQAYAIDLPQCAIITDEESGEQIPVIVIQSEQADDMIYVGYRYLGGGNGMCTLPEIELLSEPDDRFRPLRESPAI